MSFGIKGFGIRLNAIYSFRRKRFLFELIALPGRSNAGVSVNGGMANQN